MTKTLWKLPGWVHEAYKIVSGGWVIVKVNTPLAPNGLYYWKCCGLWPFEKMIRLSIASAIVAAVMIVIQKPKMSEGL